MSSENNETLEEKRFRYAPGVSMGIQQQTLNLLKEEKIEEAKRILEFGIMDLQRSFPDYPWENT